jgi:hypothetical protein
MVTAVAHKCVALDILKRGTMFFHVVFGQELLLEQHNLTLKFELK